MLRSGAGVPSNGLGVDGDFYINTTANTIYGPKTAGSWGSATSIIGPQGVAGNSLRSGNIAPTGGVGNNGDFYIDIVTWNIYGPKASGAWPAGTSLIGPAGAVGSTGASGANGTDGLNGINSFIYVAYADSVTGSEYTLVQSNDSTATLSSLPADKEYLAILTSATALGSTITVSNFSGLWTKFAGNGDRWTTFSLSSHTIGTGTKTFVVESGLAYGVGQTIVIADPSDYTKRMEAYVASYNPVNGVLVVSVQATSGSGTLANWQITLQAFTLDPPTNYGGASPSTVTVNDLPSGSSITGLSYDTLFQHIFAPFVAPTFSSFAMTGVSSTQRVGATISGSKTFTWGTTNSGNVQPNTIDIIDQTNATTLLSNTANDGSEAGVAITSVTKSSPASHTWRIVGDYLSPASGTFQRDLVIQWYWDIFAGTSANPTLTEAQIEALAYSALLASPERTYSLAGGDYKYICYPDSLGDPETGIGFRDTSTNLSVAMADSTDNAAYSNTSNGWSYALVSVTNSEGATTNYRVYRTKYTLGGSISIQLTLA